MGKMKEIAYRDGLETNFEDLGKELLKHKYLYYIKNSPIISDYEYDQLESQYVGIAKKVKECGYPEPGAHMIMEGLWKEDVEWWPTPCSKIDFPGDHIWAEEVIAEVESEK